MKNKTNKQKGLVLIVTLLVMTVMVMASLALMRKMDVSQSAIKSYASRATTDAFLTLPMEKAIQWLGQKHKADASLLEKISGAPAGYSAVYLNEDTENGIPKRLRSISPSDTKVMIWTDADLGLAEGSSNNTCYVVIERLCNQEGSPATLANACIASRQASSTELTANKTMGGTLQYGNFESTSQKVAYRISVRVDSPLNMSSFAQSIINL